MKKIITKITAKTKKFFRSKFSVFMYGLAIGGSYMFLGIEGPRFYQDNLVQQDVITQLPTEQHTIPVETPKPISSTKGKFYAYNAEVGQTDSSPLVTASGKVVYDGLIANNCLPFGTKVKVNGKVYTVDDRMNSRYDCNTFDVFTTSVEKAKQWGAPTLEYQVL